MHAHHVNACGIMSVFRGASRGRRRRRMHLSFGATLKSKSPHTKKIKIQNLKLRSSIATMRISLAVLLP
jgi:hypothetical protein